MNAAAKELGVPVKWLQAVSALESGWGTSDAAVNDNNLFGLHRKGTAGSRPAKDDPTVSVARFTRAIDSIRRFTDIVRYNWTEYKNESGTSSAHGFARFLQDNFGFGINEKNQKIGRYASDIADTANGMPDCSHTQAA